MADPIKPNLCQSQIRFFFTEQFGQAPVVSFLMVPQFAQLDIYSPYSWSFSFYLQAFALLRKSLPYWHWMPNREGK
jgi:hypothetical protein